MIEISDFKVDFISNGQIKKIIERINLTVDDGQSLVVIGPNGCGKTTFLHTVAGLNEGYSGQINIDIDRSRVALILQDIGLLPWKTVWKNATLGLDLNRKKDKSRAKRLLERLDLIKYKDDFPTQLSGGERRKLGFVRALAIDPRILLMDEPLVSLDEFTREKLQNTILELWKESKLTMILVTHDIEEASFLGERIVVLTEPPASVKATVDNQKMGKVNFRRSEAFYKVAQKLRQSLP